MKSRLLCNYTKHSASSFTSLSHAERQRRVWLWWLLAVLFGSGAPALAIDRATIELLTKPLEPALFQPNAKLDPSIVTPDQISQTGLTPPSLWWTRQQFGSNLLSYWLAYPSQDATPGRVDLIVDQQAWNEAMYLQRYAFINQFGTTAKEFRYNLRVFNLQGDLLGAQICQFTADTPEPALVATNLNAPCSIFLNPYGRGAFRGSATPDASSSTGADRLPGR